MARDARGFIEILAAATVNFDHDALGRLVERTWVNGPVSGVDNYSYNALPRQRHRCSGLRRRRPHSAWPERSEGNTPDAAPPARLPMD